ncbi:unnamed protein product [Discosporangium mesarthrocarpum]
MASSPVPKDDVPKFDFYELLGVSKTSTEKEIATAYKKLALKYHPDRTRGDEEAAEKFKGISTAYAVLSDPNKRRQYDLRGGEDLMQNDYAPMDVEGIGGMGRMMGALIGKLGVPIQTSIAQSSLTEAYDIIQHSGLKEDNPRLLPMRFGVEYKGTVEKQQSVFFFLRLSNEVARDGLIIRCNSPNKSRFKLVVFDKEGKARYQQESSKASNEMTTSALSFTPFEVSTLGDSNPLPSDDEVPVVFNRLDMFQVTRRELEAGDHLLGVYGDNWLRPATFSVMAIPLNPAAQKEAEAVVNVDVQLVVQRETLKTFKMEFLEAKKRWETTLGQLEEMTSTTQELIRAREKLYVHE